MSIKSKFCITYYSDSRACLSGKYFFSRHEVVRVSGISRSGPVSLGMLNKPTMRSTRDAKDFVHAKKTCQKDMLCLQGNYIQIYSLQVNQEFLVFAKKLYKILQISIVSGVNLYRVWGVWSLGDGSWEGVARRPIFYSIPGQLNTRT